MPDGTPLYKVFEVDQYLEFKLTVLKTELYCYKTKKILTLCRHGIWVKSTCIGILSKKKFVLINLEIPLQKMSILGVVKVGRYFIFHRFFLILCAGKKLPA